MPIPMFTQPIRKDQVRDSRWCDLHRLTVNPEQNDVHVISQELELESWGIFSVHTFSAFTIICIHIYENVKLLYGFLFS